MSLLDDAVAAADFFIPLSENDQQVVECEFDDWQTTSINLPFSIEQQRPRAFGERPSSFGNSEYANKLCLRAVLTTSAECAAPTLEITPVEDEDLFCQPDSEVQYEDPLPLDFAEFQRGLRSQCDTFAAEFEYAAEELASVLNPDELVPWYRADELVQSMSALDLDPVVTLHRAVEEDPMIVPDPAPWYLREETVVLAVGVLARLLLDKHVLLSVARWYIQECAKKICSTVVVDKERVITPMFVEGFNSGYRYSRAYDNYSIAARTRRRIATTRSSQALEPLTETQKFFCALLDVALLARRVSTLEPSLASFLESNPYTKHAVIDGERWVWLPVFGDDEEDITTLLAPAIIPPAQRTYLAVDISVGKVVFKPRNNKVFKDEKFEIITDPNNLPYEFYNTDNPDEQYFQLEITVHPNGSASSVLRALRSQHTHPFVLGCAPAKLIAILK
jgi:hypothetical protein